MIRTLIRRIARRLGVTTCYHVAAAYQRDSYVGLSVLSLTVTVKPWLHTDNYRELVDYVQSQAIRPNNTPNITSITKLGV